MDDFVNKSNDEKEFLFNAAKQKIGLSKKNVEKDFFVCWVLKLLYSIPELAPHIIFKGGTSLSKAYDLIERFSEDCDITINKSILGYDKNPAEDNISGKERVRRIENMVRAAEDFIKNKILPVLDEEIKKYLTKGSYRLELDSEDAQTILFDYPSCYKLTGNDLNNLYIKPLIRLEFGARGGIIPKEDRIITPYIAELFPNIFKQAQFSVPVLAAERTFWEKITILHSLYHKHLHGKKINDRMSRHYYDIYMLSKKGVAAKALKQAELLDEVTKNNMIFFKDNNSSHETSKIGSLKLYPPIEMLAELKKDYNSMEEMFMQDQIPFDVIMEEIFNLEKEINNK